MSVPGQEGVMSRYLCVSVPGQEGGHVPVFVCVGLSILPLCTILIFDFELVRYIFVHFMVYINKNSFPHYGVQPKFLSNVHWLCTGHSKYRAQALPTLSSDGI